MTEGAENDILPLVCLQWKKKEKESIGSKQETENGCSAGTGINHDDDNDKNQRHGDRPTAERKANGRGAGRQRWQCDKPAATW
jgi:hypothetical protein